MNDSLAELPAVQANSEISFAEIRIKKPKKSVSDIVPETIKPTAVIKNINNDDCVIK